MACKRCDELLATYKCDVTLFRSFVLDLPGKLGADSRLAAEQIDRLSQNCNTSEALMEHWRQDHPKHNEP